MSENTSFDPTAALNSLQLDLENIQPEELLPANEELELLIIKAELKPTRKNPSVFMIQVILEAPNFDNAEALFEYYVFPDPNGEKRTNNMRLRALKSLFDAAEVDISAGFSESTIQELVNKTVTATLKVTPASGDFNESRSIKTFLK